MPILRGSKCKFQNAVPLWDHACANHPCHCSTPMFFDWAHTHSQASPSTPISGGRYSPPNLKVIFGVLGALAFTAVVVFLTVPCVRRYKSTRSRGGGSRRLGDLESSGSYRSRWRFGSRKSKSSSGRQSHHHDEEEKAGRPDALLPLLPEVSTFTWSDLQRSKNSSAESIREKPEDQEEGAFEIFLSADIRTTKCFAKGWR